MKGERGTSLVETLVALALLGIIGVVFLVALASSSNARAISYEQATAKVLAESQMEYIRRIPYAFSYNGTAIPDEFVGYSASINATNMRNGNIQEITISN